MLIVLLESTVGSIALALAIGLLLKALGIRDPRLERNVWRTVLLSSLAMPVLMNMTILPVASVQRPDWLQYVQVSAPGVASSSGTLHALASWTVAIVGGVLFLRHTLGVARWWKVRRRAELLRSHGFGNCEIRVTREVVAPATVFSTVLVPPDFLTWPPEKQRLVIAHERAHVRNKDFYVQWLAHVHRCLFWFNPGAWWLVNRLSLLSEHVSDQAALRETNERAEYARILLGFAKSAARGEQLVAMARANSLASRIERILGDAKPIQPGRWRVAAVVIGLLPIIVVAASLGATVVANVTLPRSDPTKPLTHPSYPSVSRLLGEHGTVILKLHVLEDGSVVDAIIHESSGYADLDFAAWSESLRWHLVPGTVNDVPASMWGRFAVTFKLDK